MRRWTVGAPTAGIGPRDGWEKTDPPAGEPGGLEDGGLGGCGGGGVGRVLTKGEGHARAARGGTATRTPLRRPTAGAAPRGKGRGPAGHRVRPRGRTVET